MKITKIFALAVLFVATAAQAQLPSGLYSGFVSNNAFNEWCRLNRATMDFRVSEDGSAVLFWEESGFAPAPYGGFCNLRYDATFTPTAKENEWRVHFNSNFDLNFGRAVLKNGVLEITGQYTGFRTGYQTLRVRLTLGEDQNSMQYLRRIDRIGAASTLIAAGRLSRF